MRLLDKTYGKGRVRVMRVHAGDGAHREVRELSVQAMVTGDFGRTFTDADNSPSVSTDTIKNVVNVVARESMTLGKEDFCAAVAQKLLDSYPGLDGATVTAHETRWQRHPVEGAPHAHTFVLDGNGKPTAKVVADRSGTRVESGVTGFTFLKATQSGWSNFLHDPYTTLKETDDRIAATSMDAAWLWERQPADFDAANALILERLLAVFATTYSHSVQDSLWRMGSAALEAVPEIAWIRMACPNKHYLLADLSPFGLDNANQVFVATDEPHGQIECRIGR